MRTLHAALAPVYAHERAQLGHRERLRAGMADLEAGLHASWRAMVSGGQV